MHHWMRFPSPENLAEPQHQSLCHVVGREGVICLFVLRGLDLDGSWMEVFSLLLLLFLCLTRYLLNKVQREKKQAIKVEDKSGWECFWFLLLSLPFSLICLVHLIPEHMSCIVLTPHLKIKLGFQSSTFPRVRVKQNYLCTGTQVISPIAVMGNDSSISASCFVFLHWTDQFSQTLTTEAGERQFSFPDHPSWQQCF